VSCQRKLQGIVRFAYLGLENMVMNPSVERINRKSPQQKQIYLVPGIWKQLGHQSTSAHLGHHPAAPGGSSFNVAVIDR